MSTNTLPPLPEPTQGLGVHRWAYGQADMLAFYAAGFEAGKAEQQARISFLEKELGECSGALESVGHPITWATQQSAAPGLALDSGEFVPAQELNTQQSAREPLTDEPRLAVPNRSHWERQLWRLINDYVVRSAIYAHRSEVSAAKDAIEQHLRGEKT